MKTVVLLGHRARTGKDSIAAEWIRREPKKFYRLAFADKLKQTVSDLYDFNQEQMYGDAKEIEDKRYPNTFDKPTITVWDEDEYGPMVGFAGADHEEPNPIYKPLLTPRRVLQIFGQQQRAIFGDIWAQYIFNQVDKQPDGTTAFVPDFRFPNEYDVAMRWVGKNYGNHRVYAFKVNRINPPIISGATDISETALENFQFWNAEVTAENLTELFAAFEKISQSFEL